MAEKIKLTEKNLLRYGEVVLAKSRKTLEGSAITERYIIWDTDRMNGIDDERYNPNKRKMYWLVMVNGESIIMKQV